MPETWQNCPHCDICFLPPDREAVTHCPECGKSLTAPTAAWFYARDKKKVGPLSVSIRKTLIPVSSGPLT